MGNFGPVGHAVGHSRMAYRTAFRVSLRSGRPVLDSYGDDLSEQLLESADLTGRLRARNGHLWR